MLRSAYSVMELECCAPHFAASIESQNVKYLVIMTIVVIFGITLTFVYLFVANFVNK